MAWCQAGLFLLKVMRAGGGARFPAGALLQLRPEAAAKLIATGDGELVDARDEAMIAEWRTSGPDDLARYVGGWRRSAEP